MTVRWENRAQHSFLDIPSLGRYLVKRERPHSRLWIVTLNNERTSISGTRDACQQAVDRIEAQLASLAAQAAQLK